MYCLKGMRRFNFFTNSKQIVLYLVTDSWNSIKKAIRFRMPLNIWCTASPLRNAHAILWPSRRAASAGCMIIAVFFSLCSRSVIAHPLWMSYDAIPFFCLASKMIINWEKTLAQDWVSYFTATISWNFHGCIRDTCVSSTKRISHLLENLQVSCEIDECQLKVTMLFDRIFISDVLSAYPMLIVTW